jgi:ferredoxin
VDPDKCLGCEACAVVCPTGALDFAQPRAALRAGLRAAGAAAGAAASVSPVPAVVSTPTGESTAAVTIACVRADLSAGRGTGIRVECLGCVGTTDLLVAWASGVRSIYLIDAGCDACRSGPAVGGLTRAIAAAETVIAAFQRPGDDAGEVPASSRLTVTRANSSAKAPDGVANGGRRSGRRQDSGRAEEERGAGARSMGPILSRRQLLLFFGLRSAQVVKTSTIKPGRSVGSLHAQKPPPPAHQQLVGTLAKLAPQSADATDLPVAAGGLGAVLATRSRVATFGAGSMPLDALIESLHLATIALSPACDACGLCVRYCPHGALETVEECLVADPDLCSACGLCAEVCPLGAISLGPPEPFAQLADPA